MSFSSPVWKYRMSYCTFHTGRAIALTPPPPPPPTPMSKFFFQMGFSKNLSFKIAMSRWSGGRVGIRHHLGLTFWLYVTFILQWIAFIYGRDKEEDQQVFPMQERQVSLSSLFKKKPVHNAIRHFSCIFIFSKSSDGFCLYLVGRSKILLSTTHNPAHDLETHQWAPFQVAGLLHAWQISHQISKYHEGW